MQTTPPPPLKRPRRRLRRAGAALFILIAILALYTWSIYRPPTPPTEIYHGVFYACERLPSDAQGGGLLFLIKVDLTAPGIGIYTTPQDPAAIAAGWEYRLNYARSVVRDQHLAVAVNGTLFTSNSTLFRMCGDFARSNETLISNHVIDHTYAYGKLLGFDNDLHAFLNDNLPPTPQDLARARFGIETQMRILTDGKINPWGDIKPNRRTVLALSPDKHTLWLACFEKASQQFSAHIMAQHGASDAINLDGGSSTTMAIGPQSAHIPPGDVIGDWRPVANFFGITAAPLTPRQN